MKNNYLCFYLGAVGAVIYILWFVSQCKPLLPISCVILFVSSGLYARSIGRSFAWGLPMLFLGLWGSIFLIFIHKKKQVV